MSRLKTREEYDIRNAWIVRMAQAEMSYGEIGKRCGISKARAQKIAFDAGIRRRTHRTHRTHDPERILEYIVGFKMENDGNSPSVREIGEACGISSTSVVDYILNGLKDDGKIDLKGTGDARSIQVVGGEWKLKKTVPADDAPLAGTCRER